MEDGKPYLLRIELRERFPNFILENAICNHGFFMMSPNNWISSTKSFQRPLRLDSNLANSVNMSISQSHDHNFLLFHLLLDSDQAATVITEKDKQSIEEQVARMLRLTDKDENEVKHFQNIHSQSKINGFGRLFRSPSLFEDLVKSILLCNSTWRRSLSMAAALCEMQAELDPKSLGNFPSSKEIANLGEDFLRKRCSLGYRAKYIIQIARKFENGKLSTADFEEAPYKKVLKLLRKNKGFGPFACANVLSCIGFYHKVPIDTETIRHLKEVHSRKSCNTRTVRKDVGEIYDKYAPFQCLAYWSELLDSYERKFGKLSKLDNYKYHTVTGSLPFKRSKSK